MKNYSGSSTPNNYQYTGQQFDDEIDLYSLRARYYDPANGRFLSKDGAAIDMQNPIELNRYGYTANNPIKYTDPSGFDIVETVLDYANRGIVAVKGLLTGFSWKFAAQTLGNMVLGGVSGMVSYALVLAFFNLISLNSPFENWNWAEFAKSVLIGVLVGGANFLWLNKLDSQAATVINRAKGAPDPTRISRASAALKRISIKEIRGLGWIGGGASGLEIGLSVILDHVGWISLNVGITLISAFAVGYVNWKSLHIAKSAGATGTVGAVATTFFTTLASVATTLFLTAGLKFVECCVAPNFQI